MKPPPDGWKGWKGRALIVTGAREWDNHLAMYKKLSTFPMGTFLIHGDARGADRMADEIAEELKFVRIKVPYLGYLGKRGGPVRNAMMLEILQGLEKQDFAIEVVAFHMALSKSQGTKDMVFRAKREGIKTTLVGRR